jgi:RNA polymerase sigma-70 factor (ECF subfamily)
VIPASSRPLSEQRSEPEAPLSFDELYRRHADQVYGWALRYAKGNATWAEDIAHDVFVQVWRKHDNLRPGEVKGWLFRVTHNLVLSRLKRERFFVGRVMGALMGRAQHQRPDTPEEVAVRRQASRGATAALDRLPERERVVVSLKVLDGLSQREIANTLSLSEGQVSKLLKRAMGRLGAEGWEVADESP